MKNKACCWILAIVGGGILITGIMVVVTIVALSGFAHFGGGIETLDENSFLVVKLSGYLQDYDTSPDLSIFGSAGETTVNEVRVALNEARDDKKIKAVILRPMGIRGFSGIRELRESIRHFKESGKRVYAYLEYGTDRDYYLCSMADSIVLYPSRTTGLVMEGLGFSSTYLSRTFDKVGIRFNVIHAGDYKGAFENLSKDSMSVELRENVLSLYQSVFDQYTSEICADRSALSQETLRNELLNGEHYIISSHEAKEKGFADLLLDWEDLKNHLAPDEEEFPAVSVSRYLRTPSVPQAGEKEVAVVFAQGEISYSFDDGSSFGGEEGIEAGSTVSLLSDLREDEDVAAVVLRVNSPGGSAIASKLILDEIKRLKAEKPVVVSMGNSAASGGYYISCAANEIVAEPTTVTGSIGVVTVMPTAQKLYELIQAREEIVKIGKWAEFFRLDQDLSDEQKAVLTHHIQEIYTEFKEDVADGRSLTMDQVEEIAQGKIWSGERAVSIGLVDTLGGIKLAISRASSLAGLDAVDYRIRYYPKERDIFEFLAKKFRWAVQSFSVEWSLNVESLRLRAALDYLKRFYESLEFAQVILPVELDR